MNGFSVKRGVFVFLGLLIPVSGNVLPASPPPVTVKQLGVKNVDFAGINSYSQIVNWLDELTTNFTFVTVHNLGETAENRSVVIVEINAATKEDDRNADRSLNGTKIRSIFLDAGTHGREQITVTSALALINQIIQAVTVPANDTAYLSKIKWYIAPLVNPDGYEYSRTLVRYWRKNRSKSPAKTCRGVDINRNWNYHWGTDEIRQGKEAVVDKSVPSRIYSSVSWLFSSVVHPENTIRKLGLITPCSELFAGDSAFSERESFLLAEYILNLTRRSDELLTSCFSLHSMTGGQQLLFPYGYTTVRVPDYDRLNLITKTMVDAMDKVAGRRYQYGSVSETLYQTGGLQADWLYAVAGVNLTFVMEMRDNFKISPVTLIEKAFGELSAALRVLITDTTYF